MRVTVRELRDLISEKLLVEREGDVEFSKEANRIYNDLLSAVKQNKKAFTPNVYDDFMQGWDGVHATLGELGVDVPEILKDLVVTFTWGTNASSGFYIMPSQRHSSGIIGINYYNEGLPKNVKIDAAGKRAMTSMDKLLGGRVLEADDDIIPYISSMLQISKTTFIHELRHAFDALVREDDGDMAQHMHQLLKKSEKDPSLVYVGDDEYNAHIVTAIEDTIEDFKRATRNKPTKTKAKKWAPTGDALWKRFEKNLNMGIKKFSDEKKMLHRAGGRLTSVWEDYVEGLPE